MKPVLTALLALSCAALTSSAAAAAPSWQGEVIYQVMPDRFYSGDAGNDLGANKSDPKAFHGGDLAGLIQKLEYIETLGATALWTTPIYLQPPSAMPGGWSGFHGYWPWEFTTVDPRFGTLEQYKSLLSSAKERGMKVMLDQVVNHYGYGAPAVSSTPGWFHKDGECAKLGNTDIFCPLAGLPDLAQENPAVRKLLFDNNAFWTALGVDGFRYDAVKHVPLEFMRDLAAQNQKDGLYTLGELFETSLVSTGRIASFQKAGLNSMFDFPLNTALTNTIMGGRSLDNIRFVLEKDSEYPAPNELAIFLDNHDVPRFASRGLGLSDAEVNARVVYGMRALMTLRGIPVIWQGSEIGMRGGVDPDNRRDMRFEDSWSPAERALFEVTRSAIAVRQGSSALKTGALALLPVPDSLSSDLLLFTRTAQDTQVLAAWNNSDKRRSYSLKLSSLPEALRGLGSRAARELFGQDAKLGSSGGYLHLTLPARAASAFPLR